MVSLKLSLLKAEWLSWVAQQICRLVLGHSCVSLSVVISVPGLPTSEGLAGRRCPDLALWEWGRP